jgi:hypothetical protein
MIRQVFAFVVCGLGVAAGLGSTAWAQPARQPVDVAALGPKVGQTIPTFRLVDQRGQWQTLGSIAGRRGAMLVFVRSADW